MSCWAMVLYSTTFSVARNLTNCQVNDVHYLPRESRYFAAQLGNSHVTNNQHIDFKSTKGHVRMFCTILDSSEYMIMCFKPSRLIRFYKSYKLLNEVKIEI